MRTLEQLIAEVPALAGLSDSHRATIAGCASNRVLAEGEQIMREGERADTFCVIRAGTVALSTTVPGRGAVTVQTLHAGDLLGWSWLVPPYRTAFDAVAAEPARVIAFDGACLRGKCDADPALGYALLKVLAAVFAERLQDTRLRLLDLYGATAGG